KFAIDAAERHDYFKVLFGKGNNSRRGKEIWRRFVSVTLPNDEGGQEEGDEVGVLVEWVQPGHGEMTPAREEAERKSNHVYMTLPDPFNGGGAPHNPSRRPYVPPRHVRQGAGG